MEETQLEEGEYAPFFRLLDSAGKVFKKGWIYLHLDQFPEEVDTRHEQSLAALEATLRSQGIPLFIGQFFLLWLAMSWALRRRKIQMKMSATAAASAYVLCQFSFFMLFAVLSTFGKDRSISVTLMLVLLVLDYHQWLGMGYKKSLRLAISTGIRYGILFLFFLFLVAAASFLIAYVRN